MTDKTMPTNIWACVQSDGVNHWVCQYPVYGGSTEYTLVHNNPDTIVIKRSDAYTEILNVCYDKGGVLGENTEWFAKLILKALKQKDGQNE